MGWEAEWMYAPTPGARKMQERIQAQIDKALGDLRYRNEKDAAKAFAAMIADDLTRLEITNAVTRFHLNRTGNGEKARQGDARDLAKELKDTLGRVDKLGHRLARRRFLFEGTPGVPDHHEIARKGSDAFEGVAALARLADDLHRAVIAEHGKDDGNKAISERLAGDPLDNLASALSEPWRRHGYRLEGKALTHFMQMLRAIHEGETGKEEIGSRRIKERIENLIENST